MTLFKLLMLAISVSITCNGNAAFETSEFHECRISDNSSIDHSMLNVHVNLSEGELDLLQIEGHCFLFCTTKEEYSNEVNSINAHANNVIRIINIL